MWLGIQTRKQYLRLQEDFRKAEGGFFLMCGHASRVLDDRLLVTFIVKGSWEAILPKGRKLVYYHDCFTTFGAFIYTFTGAQETEGRMHRQLQAW